MPRYTYRLKPGEIVQDPRRLVVAHLGKREVVLIPLESHESEGEVLREYRSAIKADRRRQRAKLDGSGGSGQ